MDDNIGSMLTIGTNSSINVDASGSTVNMKFINNPAINFQSPTINLGDFSGNINIAGGFGVAKNTASIGTIVFNENNIIFQVGNKAATLQLS